MEMNNSCLDCGGSGKEAGTTISCFKCKGIGKIMNDPIQLVTTKPDAELAEELKAEIREAIKPYLEVSTKIHKLGFILQMQMSPNAFGEVIIQQLNLMKQF